MASEPVVLAMSVTARWMAGTPSASSMDGSRHGRGLGLQGLELDGQRGIRVELDPLLHLLERLEREEPGDAVHEAHVNTPSVAWEEGRRPGTPPGWRRARR